MNPENWKLIVKTSHTLDNKDNSTLQASWDRGRLNYEEINNEELDPFQKDVNPLWHSIINWLPQTPKRRSYERSTNGVFCTFILIYFLMGEWRIHLFLFMV